MELKDLPKHVAELIKGVPKIVAETLGRPKAQFADIHLCRWCLHPASGSRKWWCSRDCREKFNELVKLPGTIYHRDKGICRACSCEIWRLQQVLDYANIRYQQYRRMDRRVRRRESTMHSLINTPRHGKDVTKIRYAVMELEQMAVCYPELFVKTNGIWRPTVPVAHVVDFVKPPEDGGTATSGNLRLLCVWCVAKRGHHDISD